MAQSGETRDISTERMNILYKYVAADRAMNCLPEVGDGALRATQPSALNDPFECAISFFVMEGDGTEEETGLDCAYARVLTGINNDTPVTGRMVRRAKERYGSLFAKELLTSQLSTKFGIVSFSADHLNPLMWSHYTIDGSGFVIGYDRRELQKLGRTSDRLKAVQYDTQPCALGVSFDPIAKSEASAGSNEREWRLIVELNQTIGTGRIDAHGQPINLIRVPNEAVVSVHYTERTPNQAVDEASKRLANPNNRYAAKRPLKLTLAPNSYAYVEG